MRAFPSTATTRVQAGAPWGGRVHAGVVVVGLAPPAALPWGLRAHWYCLSGRLVGSELPNFPSHLQSAVCPPLLGGDE